MGGANGAQHFVGALRDRRARAEDAGGAMSLLKYKTVTAEISEADIKKEAIDWLREYNLDDIRATFAVREYMRDSFNLYPSARVS